MLPNGYVTRSIHVYGIFAYSWLIFMVNVGKYTIHGSYGKLLQVCYRYSSRSPSFAAGFFPHKQRNGIYQSQAHSTHQTNHKHEQKYLTPIQKLLAGSARAGVIIMHYMPNPSQPKQCTSILGNSLKINIYIVCIYIYINLHCYPSKIGNLMTPVKNILRLVVSITIHTITWTPWKWRFFKT